MKKSLLFIFHFIFLFFINPAEANHIAGADASWKCLGNDTFQIKLVIYRRCTDGAPSLSNPGIQIISDSCANPYTVNSGAPISYTVEDITPLCATAQKLCPSAGGSGQSTAQIPIGLERHTWTYKIYLGGNYANCCWYKLSWQASSRIPSITTGYAGTVLTQEYWLNRCVCNNSPKFTNDILIIKCAGQDVRYNLGMVDDEHDSLSYRLSPPLGGSYTSPWNHNYPLTSLGGNNPNKKASPPTGFNLDSFTGEIAFRPMQVQVSIIKITILEYRKINGIVKIIGVTSREMPIFITQNCNNKLPSLSGPFDYDLCTGTQTCFTISSSDADTNDTTRISSNSSYVLPGSTFNVSGNLKNASGTLCWTPVDSNASSNPYHLSVKVSDDHCPLVGDYYCSYNLFVHPALKATTYMEPVACANYNFKSLVNDPTAFKRKWKIYYGASLIDSIMNKDTVYNYRFNATGTYYIRYSAENYCGPFVKTDTIVITNATRLSMTAGNDTTICYGNSVTLKAQVFNGTPPYTYKWYINGAVVSTTQNYFVTPATTTNYVLEIFDTDTCKINNTASIKVDVEYPYFNVKKLPDTLVCIGTPTVITPTVVTGILPYHCEWYENGVLIDSNFSLSITPTYNATYILKMRSSDKCFNLWQDTFNVTVDSGVQNVPLSDFQACFGTYLVITPVIRGKAPYQYQWFKDGAQYSTFSTLTLTVNGSHDFVLKVTSANKCKNILWDTLRITESAGLELEKIKDTMICTGSQVAVSPKILSGNPVISYKWFQSGALISSAAVLQVSPVVNSVYILNVTSADSCKNTWADTFSVTMAPIKQLTINASSTNINKGQNAVLHSNGKSNFTWSGNDIITNWGDSVLVKPSATSVYKLICRNSYDCLDTAEITINVSNVGVQELRIKNEELRIFPNPAKDEITIFNSKLINGQFIVVNILGQVQLEGVLKNEKTSVNISSLKPGIYFVKVGNETLKFVKR